NYLVVAFSLLVTAQPSLQEQESSSPANATFNVDEQRLRAFYWRLGNNLSFIVSPILLALGGLGNPLCIVVLLKKYRTNQTVIYLCILAAFDFLVLYTGLLRQYLRETFNYDLRHSSTLVCKAHVFLTYVFMEVSSYILVAVTYNRFTIVFNRTGCCRATKP